MTTIHSTVEPRKHVHVTPIGDQDVTLNVGRPGRPAVSLAAIRIPVAELRAALGPVPPAGPDIRTDEEVDPVGDLATDGPTRPTAEMVQRGHAALVAQTGRPQSVAAVEAALTAAMNEPPTRPEGAEELADDMEDCLRDVKLEDVGLDGLADRLAAMGYRKAES